jgi:hypothetical protein
MSLLLFGIIIKVTSDLERSQSLQESIPQSAADSEFEILSAHLPNVIASSLRLPQFLLFQRVVWARAPRLETFTVEPAE